MVINLLLYVFLMFVNMSLNRIDFSYIYFFFRMNIKKKKLNSE